MCTNMSQHPCFRTSVPRPTGQVFHDRAEVSRCHNLKLVSTLDLKNSMVMWLSASSVFSLDHTRFTTSITKPLRRLRMQMWSSLSWTATSR